MLRLLLPLMLAAPALGDMFGLEDTPFVAEEKKLGQSLYHDVLPMLWASHSAYLWAKLVKSVRDTPEEELKSWTFPPWGYLRDKDGNETGIRDWPNLIPQLINEKNRSKIFPISFFYMSMLMTGSQRDGEDAFEKDLGEFDRSAQSRLFEAQGRIGNPQLFELSELDELRTTADVYAADQCYMLEAMDSLESDTQCVYAILRDDYRKRIIVMFRGTENSEDNLDLKMDLKAQLVDMEMPANLADFLAAAANNPLAKETIPVHAGFHSYLFANPLVEAPTMQKANEIMEILKRLMVIYPDHSLYSTGHSLGGAMASLLAFFLAATSIKEEWIPRPIRCVSFGSPMVGGQEFQDAFKLLEKEGLLRYIRITNREDFIPTLPPFSLNMRGLYKHVGIHLNLLKENQKGENSGSSGENDSVCSCTLRYPRSDNRFQRALDHCLLGKPVVSLRNWKPVVVAGESHGLELTNKRLDENKEQLMKHTIDGLYKEKNLVDFP